MNEGDRREDLAWAAGFYEGEGNIGTRVNKKSPGWIGLTMQIHSIDEDTLRRFHAIAGFGAVCGPYDRSHRTLRGNHKPIWQWAGTGIAVATFIEDLRPWLGKRRIEQADLMLARRREYEEGRHGHLGSH